MIDGKELVEVEEVKEKEMQIVEIPEEEKLDQV